MKTLGLVILSSGLALAACSGGIDNNNGPDAGPGGDGPGNNVNCLIDANLGTVTPVDQTAFSLANAATPNDPFHYEITGPINNDAVPDRFLFQVYDQTQPFPNDITPGTYTIAGPETDYSLCGVCVRLVGDSNGDRQLENTNSYMATSGTVTIDSVSPRFSGTLTGVTLQHVIFPMPGNPVHIPADDGCTTQFDSLSFDAAVEVRTQRQSAPPEMDPKTPSAARLELMSR